MTILAVNPVKGSTVRTVRRMRGRAGVDITRCSVQFIGPLSRGVLARINGGFGHVIAVRSNTEVNKVKSTMLR